MTTERESSPTGNGYSEAWAQGIIGRFESGFTQGTFGVGVDAFAMTGIKLDTGGGRNGARSSFDVLPVDGNGDAEDEYTKLGGSIKARAFDTVVNMGDVFLRPQSCPSAIRACSQRASEG